MDREQAARQNHRGSYNCAQSVYAAYADLLGLAPGDALRAVVQDNELHLEKAAVLKHDS